MQSETSIAVLFDIEKPVNVTVQSGGERKTAKLRIGPDDPWMKFQRDSITRKQYLGRGKSQSDSSGSETAGLELFGKLRVDTDGVEFDAAEATAAVRKLDSNEITEVTRGTDSYVIRMRALGCDLVHELKIPSQKAVNDYSRGSVRVTDTRRAQEIRVLLEPSGALYDQLLIRVEGYAHDKVPIIHKAAVVTELISDLQASDEEPSFF